MGQTRCSAHQECALPDTECGFVDAYLEPSFGNIMCGTCTSRPTCLVGTGGVGRCVCMLRPVTTQACAVPGQRITPNPGQVCLVSLGGGASSSSSYAATWSGLASAQCVLLNQAQLFCLTVYDGDASMRLAVGMALLGGRRLLGAAEAVAWNASEWRDAAEPCKSLMLGGVVLGPVDRYTASECHRWRDIGERAVVKFNLTRVEPVLFTSWTLLVERLAGDPEAAVQMARVAPRLGGFLLSYQSWFQPVVVLGVRYWGLINRSSPLFRAVFADEKTNGTAGNTTVPMVLELMARPFLRRAKARRQIRELLWNTTAVLSTRRLLQSSWRENLAAVKDYTVEIVKGGGGALSPDFAAQWTKGPFVWPPNYDYKSGAEPCLVASLLFNYTLVTFKSTAAYYTGQGAPPRPNVSRTFTDCLPALPMVSMTWNASSATGRSADFFRWATDFIDRGRFVAYVSRQGAEPSQLSKDVNLIFTCDFDAVQHCSVFTRDLAWGALIVTLALGGLSYVARAVGVPLVDPLLFLAFLPLVSVFVFGVSPLCAPLVPTCLLDEILHLLEYFLPSSIAVPSALRVSPTCTDSPACFRSCAAAPFAFASALDNVAWISLRAGLSIPDIPWPAVVSEWIGVGLDALGVDRFAFAEVYAAKAAYLDWADMQLAQDICCALTLFNLLPFVLGAVVAVLLIGYAAVLGTCVAEIALALVLDALLYTHTR